MPKVDPKAILEYDDVRRGHIVAHEMGILEGTLYDWMYEFGSRAAEPGLQLVKDIDIRSNRARPLHLKYGTDQEWHALLPFCRESLPKWLPVRQSYMTTAEQASALFPSRVPGHCYTCKGTGQRHILRQNKETKKRYNAEAAKCHHCAGTGKRWGLSRYEVHVIVTAVLKGAGVPLGRRHPHVLRHSIITHLLEGGIAPAVVQDRVGHRLLSTTLEYARATKHAAAQLESALGHIYRKEPT